MAFLDRARDANIATAIPRLKLKRAAIPFDRTQQKNARMLSPLPQCPCSL